MPRVIRPLLRPRARQRASDQRVEVGEQVCLGAAADGFSVVHCQFVARGGFERRQADAGIHAAHLLLARDLKVANARPDTALARWLSRR